MLAVLVVYFLPGIASAHGVVASDQTSYSDAGPRWTVNAAASAPEHKHLDDVSEVNAAAHSHGQRSPEHSHEIASIPDNGDIEWPLAAGLCRPAWAAAYYLNPPYTIERPPRLIPDR